MDSLNPLRARLFKRPACRDRLTAAEDWLVSHSRDAQAAEIYLVELFTQSARQMGGGIHLGPTFVRTVSETEGVLLEALPEHTRAALDKLVTLVPIPLSNPHSLAHALCIDGETVAHLRGSEYKPVRKRTDSKEAYRRLAQRFHPDRGGDAQVMADINALKSAAGA